MKGKIILLTVLCFAVYLFASENYYVRQMIIADMQERDVLDTAYQETYIGGDILIISDGITKTFIDDHSYTFYNYADSTYFERQFGDLDEISAFSDSQLKNFSIENSGEKAKVGEWETEIYNADAIIMGMDMEMDMYVAKKTGYPTDLLLRMQDKMHSGSANITGMIEKIKSTGGIVVKEVARIGGTVVSEKQIVEIKAINRIDDQIKKRPENFTKIGQ